MTKLRVYQDTLTEEQLNHLKRYGFIEYVDNYLSADTVINSEPRGLKIHLNIGESADVKESGLIDLLLDIYRGLTPDAYIEYLLGEASNDSLFGILKSLPGDTNDENAKESFNARYTKQLLQPFRKDYAIKILGAIKIATEELHEGSYARLISMYSRGQTDINVDGQDIWSPELIYAFVSQYLMWTIPAVDTLYAEYVSQRSTTFLRQQLLEYFKSLPDKLYAQAIRECYL